MLVLGDGDVRFETVVLVAQQSYAFTEIAVSGRSTDPRLVGVVAAE